MVKTTPAAQIRRLQARVASIQAVLAAYEARHEELTARAALLSLLHRCAAEADAHRARFGAPPLLLGGDGDDDGGGRQMPLVILLGHGGDGLARRDQMGPDQGEIETGAGVEGATPFTRPMRGFLGREERRPAERSRPGC